VLTKRTFSGLLKRPAPAISGYSVSEITWFTWTGIAQVCVIRPGMPAESSEEVMYHLPVRRVPHEQYVATLLAHRRKGNADTFSASFTSAKALATTISLSSALGVR